MPSIDFRVSVEPQQGASYADQLAVAEAAEQLGFSAFHRSDHYVAMSGDGWPGPTDSWVTLAGLARETSTIRLGTMVTSATFRHPGPLAISVAQADAMSGGRVDFGIGAGWFEAEHQAYTALPPIIGGQGAKRTPALAAKFATEFNVAISPLDTVTTQFDRVRAAADAAGRPLESPHS